MITPSPDWSRATGDPHPGPSDDSVLRPVDLHQSSSDEASRCSRSSSRVSTSGCVCSSGSGPGTVAAAVLEQLGERRGVLHRQPFGPGPRDLQLHVDRPADLLPDVDPEPARGAQSCLVQVGAAVRAVVEVIPAPSGAIGAGASGMCRCGREVCRVHVAEPHSGRSVEGLVVRGVFGCCTAGSSGCRSGSDVAFRIARRDNTASSTPNSPEPSSHN